MVSTLITTLLMTTGNSLLSGDDTILPRKASFGGQLAEATPNDTEGSPQVSGALVVRVLPQQTAQLLGVQEKDVILKLNNQTISGSRSLIAELKSVFGGQQLSLEVWRPGEKKVIKLTGKAIERAKQKSTEEYTVQYSSVESLGKRIRVITTIPKVKQKSAAIFLMGGIGSYSIDGEFSNTAYGNVLESFAKSGFATVRVDKPGQGDSQGPAEYTDLLFDEEADAYLQALRAAKKNPSINADNIIVFGHSMGGCFGPLVASQESVKGLAVYGTVAKSWYEYTLENERRQSLLAGARPDEIEAEIKESTQVFFRVFEEGMSIATIESKYPELKEALNSRFPDKKTYSGVGLPFFQQLAKKNMMSYWAKVDAKTLVMYGENDFISGEGDHKMIADAMNIFKPKSSEFKIIPASDHGFFETTSPLDSRMKWGKPGNKVNPAMLKTFTDWVTKTVG